MGASPVPTDSPGGLAGHSAALIGFRERFSPEAVASDLGYAEIVGSEPTPGILTE